MKTKTLLIFFILSLFISSCTEDVKNTNNTKPIKVKTSKVEIQNISKVIHTSGKLSSKSEMKLSFKTGGIINKILVNTGQSVQKGQVLAQLNLSEIQAYANQAKLGLEKAGRDFKRAENLYKDSVVTLEQFQNAKTQLEIAESKLQIANFNLRYSTITAPVTGKILNCLSQENEVIGAGYPVFLLGSDQNNWVVKANITDKDIVNIQIGDTATIKFDAYPLKDFKAQIIEISGAADPYTGTYEVELYLDKTDLSLSSGFTAKLDIYSSTSEKLMLIPYESLVDADGSTGYVYIIKEKKPVRVKVVISQIKDEYVYILPELDINAEIISEGVSYIKKNSRIEIIKN